MIAGGIWSAAPDHRGVGAALAIGTRGRGLVPQAAMPPTWRGWIRWFTPEAAMYIPSFAAAASVR